ncbi:putative ATP-dependent RNA helicase DHX33 [Catenaria anguillulae PL171]|uniref:RNA helicase n=1 Tax=Catenaria anguillulae PL171 TaxID=765915 RepID=A0A1Y2HS22_9FUNG|nr:putative ATP-dependent RNA helicase DHX33 [Catenaria anguillulae PL171]
MTDPHESTATVGAASAKQTLVDARKSLKDKLLKTRKTLPVWHHRDQIVDAVRKHAVTVVVGETGSGKTTQIPQFLLGAGLAKSIAVTQPRRISAISLAQRVAQEQGVQLGQRVGYTVRFDDVSSKETKIKFVTDGMLLRELLLDPMLQRYDAIVLDEAHERSVRTDVLLGMVKRILKQRPNLKVIVMSATLESGLFTNFFPGAHLLHIPGRLHEIRVFHAHAPPNDYVDASLRTIFNIHQKQPLPGDVLAFFNGQEDIEAASSLLREYQDFYPNLVIAPLFANLPLSMQKAVFEPTPAGQRKVVLSTNIAETSVTIPGVRYVVDHGLAKIKVYHARVGLESLVVSPISQSSALQRAGRAGREAPGHVYRLYMEDTFNGLERSTAAEIQRANLSNVVLQLKAAGVDNVLDFDFIERPSQDALVAAHQTLVALGAIDRATRALTPTGRDMSKYPLDPSVSRVLVDAVKNANVTLDLLTVLALLSQETVFYTPSGGDARDDALEQRRKFVSSDGDLITWLNVVRAYEEVKGDDKWCQGHYVNARNIRQVLNVRKQLVDQVGASSVTTRHAAPDELLPQLLRGFFGQVAFLQPNGRFSTVSGRHEVSIHPSSVLFGRRNVPVVSFVELVAGDTGRWFIRGVSRVDAGWVKEAADTVMRIGQAHKAEASAAASKATET